MSRRTEASSRHLTAVPALDATGLLNLQMLVRRLNEHSVKVILAGVQPQPMRVFAGAGWRNRHGRLRIFRSFERGIELARRTRTPGVEGRHS